MNKELLKKIALAYGPSGNEFKAAAVITEEIKPYVDEIRTDALGNLIAVKKGKGKKIMVAAHMDEIGFMVKSIDEKGFIKFSSVGSNNPAAAYFQRVQFENGIKGVIGVEKLEGGIKDLTLEKMYIDIGARTKEEAMTMVSVGDIAVVSVAFEADENFVTSKALDDRVGCYIAIEAAKTIAKTDNEIYFVFTTQEELGLRGSKVAAYGINPDLGYAIDVTPSGDTPNCNPMTVKLGEGVAIKVKDAGIIVPPEVKKDMVETCKLNDIPYQMEVLDGGSTDTASINLTKNGIPAGCISVPTRYLHSSAEKLCISDVDNAVKLLIKLLEK